MSNRRIVQVLDQYKKARLTFVQNISDMAMRSQNVALLKKTNVLDLLKPLVSDVCPQIKHCALVALGRLIHADETIAEQIVKSGTLSVLLNDLTSGNKYQNSAILFIIRSICKHNEKLTETVVRNGGLQALVYCLEDFEPIVKESAAWGVGYIARHTENMAQECVDHGALPLLMLCLQEPELSLKQIATIALSDIAKHSDALATSVVDAGALLEILFQQPTVAVEVAVPCISAIGFIAGQSAELAMTIIGYQSIQIFERILNEPADESLVSVTVWAIGQIGRHTTEHAHAVASANIFQKLIALYQSPTTSADLRLKCQNSLKVCLQKCTLVPALEPLLWTAPPEILKYVLGQYSKVLPKDPKARRLFVTSGGLQKVQQIEAKPGTTLMEYITVINSCFPDEIVRYYSPGYPETLLEKLEQYSPQMMTVLRESGRSNEGIQTEILQRLSRDEANDVSNEL
ncbi:sperm-associated antigen 6-like isoform X4 [Cylas formicarius]|uniref:sperm-associated antigen 6-like isoform X4 n=1 Tax=Cylas formicarius TaxID=197179 RepID=UPI00295838C1|nr:sperm-associated antigen 6-like isoform X4 [Cylas formicarius]